MWVTALVIGFAGSLHCLGMCSPLAMAVTSIRTSAFVNKLLYNAGRIFTYGILGAAISSSGLVLPMHKFQNVISILLGIALLAVGFGGLRKVSIPGLTPALHKFISFLKMKFSRQLTNRSRASMAFLGALNGLLPCGLSAIALAWCITLEGPLDGFNFMLVFGSGTLPVMLGLTGLVPAIVRKLNWKLQRVTSTMVIISGFVLIARVFFIHLPHATSLQEGLADIILCR